MAESKRQLKYAKLIQKELGEIFQKDGRSIYGNAFVTITDVAMSPDLGMARVYVSVMMVEDKNKFIQLLNTNKSEIRGYLGNRIGKQVRTVPDLSFYIDDTFDQAERLNQVFKEIKDSSSKENHEKGE